MNHQARHMDFCHEMLQRNMQNAMDPIDNARKLYDWSLTIENSKIRYIYCSQNEYDQTEKLYRKRMKEPNHSMHFYMHLIRYKENKDEIVCKSDLKTRKIVRFCFESNFLYGKKSG